MRRRSGRLGPLLTLVVLALAAPAMAQFPGNTTPITIVMPYPPGGLGDYFVRLVAPKLAESLGTTVLVDNRAGANGAIGTAAVARAKPDGHTIVFVPASTVTTNQWLMKDLGYDPLRDLSPLALVLAVPNVLVVNPSVPAQSLPELLELARRKPGSLNYASVGMGSSTHLQAEMLKREAKIDIVHVAYKGAGPALQDLLAGQVQMMFDNMPSVLPMIQAGKLRALAVTSAKPSPALPDVPPVGKFVPDFEQMPWFAFLGPTGLPPDIVATLNEHLIRAVRSPDVVQALAARGGEITTSTPSQLGDLIKVDSEKIGRLIKEAGITPQ
jgi:tripartite-type tricarboxylate transporter receptor subunit TctC